MTTIPEVLAARRAELDERLAHIRGELEQARKQVDDRRNELELVHAELAGIDLAIEAYGGTDDAPGQHPAGAAPPPRAERRNIRNLVLETVDAKPGLRFAEIAERIGVAPSRVKAVVEYWASKGRLTENGGLVWVRPPEVAVIDETKREAEAAE